MPWDSEFKIPFNMLKCLIVKYRRALWFKANPRDESYMRRLFYESYPEGKFINVDNDLAWANQLKAADVVVLLYPDAIGHGYSRIEKIAEDSCLRWATLRVLNGRKRDFVLSMSTKLGLKVRRGLEQSMLLEFTILLPFIAMTLLLLVFDLIRGQR